MNENGPRPDLGDEGFFEAPLDDSPRRELRPGEQAAFVMSTGYMSGVLFHDETTGHMARIKPDIAKELKLDEIFASRGVAALVEKMIPLVPHKYENMQFIEALIDAVAVSTDPDVLRLREAANQLQTLHAVASPVGIIAADFFTRLSLAGRFTGQ